MTDLRNYQVGDKIEMNFSFVEEEWNYVDLRHRRPLFYRAEWPGHGIRLFGRRGCF